MVSTVRINEHFDETAYELRELLGQLEGVTELEWIDNLSRPSKDGPNPRNEQAMRAYALEIKLALARVLLSQQERIEALEAKLEQTTKKK